MFIPVYSHQLLRTVKPTRLCDFQLLSLHLSSWILNDRRCSHLSFFFWRMFRLVNAGVKISAAGMCNKRVLSMCGHGAMLSHRISMMRFPKISAAA